MMSFFTVELASNASFDCYPNNNLGSFTNFLPEQIILDGEREVAITELPYPSLHKNTKDGKFFYLDEATPDTNHRIITHLVQGYTPPTLIF